MDRVVAEHKGIMYSLQPHGLKSRLVTISAVFVAAFGGALLAASPAQAVAVGPIPVAVCGNSAEWFVNGDEGDRAPLGTSDGLVFSPRDLIHHAADLPVSSLLPGTYSASPVPDQPSFFSVEVRSGLGAYGTLRWDGALWWITIGPDTSPPSGFLVTPGTSSDPNPVVLLAGKVTKWGPFDPATDRVVTFGVGYTNNPPGTVTSLVSSISFNGATYNVSCPVAPSPSPVMVPQPAKTIIVTKKPVAPAVAPVVQVVPSNTPDPTPSLVATPSPSPSTIVSPSPEATISNLNPVSVDSSGGGSSLAGWGIAVAGAGGFLLAAMGLTGVLKRRRYQASHAPGVGDNSQTQVIPAASADDHSVSDYNPNFDGHDPALGGYAGESNQYSGETEILPPAPDTKASPPVE